MKVLQMVLCLAVLVGLSGCARTRSLVVLLPDADGRVGRIQIQTSQGQMALDKPYHALAVTSGTASGSPWLMPKQEIEAKFDRAMAAEPSQRLRFEKHTLYCLKNATELTPDSKARLPEIVRQLTAGPPLEIYVIGHADRVGTESYNWQLSHKRALAVQQKLVANGINSKMILISFLGESEPQVVTPDEVEEPRNRRVALVMEYTKSK